MNHHDVKKRVLLDAYERIIPHLDDVLGGLVRECRDWLFVENTNVSPYRVLILSSPRTASSSFCRWLMENKHVPHGGEYANAAIINKMDEREIKFHIHHVLNRPMVLKIHMDSAIKLCGMDGFVNQFREHFYLYRSDLESQARSFATSIITGDYRNSSRKYDISRTLLESVISENNIRETLKYWHSYFMKEISPKYPFIRILEFNDVIRMISS